MQNLQNNNVEEIVEKYGDMLYRICYVLLKNSSDAEDTVQETIIKYIERKPVLKDVEHTKAWLITVAKNKCMDLIRNRKRYENIEIGNIIEMLEEPINTEILEVLMSLPEKIRLVLVLYYVEEYQVKEIAKIINKTQSAVKMRLQKGRRLLREKYESEVQDNV